MRYESFSAISVPFDNEEHQKSLGLGEWEANLSSHHLLFYVVCHFKLFFLHSYGFVVYPFDLMMVDFLSIFL